MKLILSLLSLCVSAVLAENVFNPWTLSYDDIKVGNELFMKEFEEALQTHGIVGISSIPGFAELKKKTLESSYQCGQTSKAAKTTTFADLTERRTLATAYANEYLQFDHHDNSPACEQFNRDSMEFRKMVTELSSLFVEFLDKSMGAPTSAFLRSETKHFSTFRDILEHSEQLEHFHAYSAKEGHVKEGVTIDLHTDQGLFIAFTTPLMTGETTSSGIFLLQNSDGDIVRVNLESKDDHLIFMLGDGVNQYINMKLSDSKKLHAAPHSFEMDKSGDDSRLWYGRMVLPPNDAISEQHGLSYGDLRRTLIDHPDSSDYMAMGCSGELFARELSTVCDEDSLFCWNRCMNFSAIGIYYSGQPLSDEFCKSQGFEYLRCIDPTLDTLYNSTGCNNGLFAQTTPNCIRKHGAFIPACTNSTTDDFLNPPLPLQPSGCDAFESFVDSEEYSYKKVYNEEFVIQAKKNQRMNPQREELCFRLTYNGFPGWMAIGLFNPSGQQIDFEASTGRVRFIPNLMMGAPVVLGIFNDPEYPFEVHEYITHPSEPVFQTPSASGITELMDADPPRGWDIPVENESILDVSMQMTSCYSEMKFCTDSIAGQQLLVDGFNNFMWGYEKTSATITKHSSFLPTTRGVEVVQFFEKSGATKIDSQLFAFGAIVSALVVLFT